MTLNFDLLKYAALYLITSVFFVGCASKTGAQPKAATVAPSTTPELVEEGIISTHLNELNSTFSPDGNLFLFTIANNSFSNTYYTIFFSELKNGVWSAPQIAPFSGQYSDADPFFAPDGNRLYFISYRPVKANVPKNDFDIWFVEFNQGAWSTPHHLNEPINSNADELYPSVSENGNLYFSAENGSNGYDIKWTANRNGVFAAPQSLSDSINTTAVEYDAYIAPDESYLLFTSIGRKDGLGSGDLYISYRRNGVWGTPRNLGSEINSEAMDQCPSVSPDGKLFFFTSFRENKAFEFKKPVSTADYLKRLHSSLNGLGNIFRVDSKAVFKKKKD